MEKFVINLFEFIISLTCRRNTCHLCKTATNMRKVRRITGENAIICQFQSYISKNLQLKARLFIEFVTKYEILNNECFHCLKQAKFRREFYISS